MIERVITEAMREAVPRPLYSCADEGCAAEVSYPAADLTWSDGFSTADGGRVPPGFYCWECLDHHSTGTAGPSHHAGPSMLDVIAEAEADQ